MADHANYLRAVVLLLPTNCHWSDLSVSVAFSCAALCFLSKLMTRSLKSSWFTLEKPAIFWFQLGTNFSGAEPITFWFKGSEKVQFGAQTKT